MTRSLIFTAAIAVAAIVRPAQAQQGNQDFRIDVDYRTRIIDGVSQKLANGYFDAAQANVIRTQLTKKSVRAAYDTISTASGIASALTRDLQQWTHDRHLKVVFSVEPRPLPKESGGNAISDAEIEEAGSRNFGFHQVMRYTGNVGYLEIGRFEPASIAGNTLKAAMQLLANTDAIVIDLRQNGGGYADMVALMTSYFLPEQKLLVTLEKRDKKESSQIWSASYVEGPRYLNKPIFVLTSGRTFSGAEALAYDLKHFANATIVGEKTRGGANPGSFQQLDEHFAVFVPTARVVHAATGTNWDADGIAPDVAVPSNKASLTALKLALEKLVATKPNDSRYRVWKDALDDMNSNGN